jgi:hypothetical protein
MGFAFVLGLAACGERREVTSDNTRELTMRDENLRPEVSADERFGRGRRDAPPAAAAVEDASPVVATVVPEAWVVKPSTGFRLLNYGFGDGGEVYVSLSRGGVAANVNRWLKQFGADALDEAGFAALEPVEVSGYRGVWVSVDGDFGGGMGAGAREDWALRGIVAEGPRGILTVKLLGPADEVRGQESALREFVSGLTFAE